MKLTIANYQSFPRPTLKIIAAALLIPATLNSGFDPAKYDAFLLFVTALYGLRAAEKVTGIVTEKKSQ